MSSKHITAIMAVLSKPPGFRAGTETIPVANWLRSKVRYFKDAPDEAMLNLVAECGVWSRKEDEIIILEGDVGDTMYIVLSGVVDIHRMSEAETEETDGDAMERPVNQTLFVDRSPLGPMLSTIGLGSIFGEIALIEDCPRTASVVAGGPVQLAVVPRILYNSTVRAVIERQYKTKLDFVNRSPYFAMCNPRYKKQLLMALEVHNFDYSSEIIHQGDSMKSIFYIISGEVRLSCDPSYHIHQYMNKLNDDDRTLLTNIRSQENTATSARCFRNLELCLLGSSTVDNNENTTCTFGEAEAVLGLDTYAMTATATTKTVLLSLAMRHVDRYIFKRNQPAVEKMRLNAVPRYTFWIRRYPNSLSFFQYILIKIEEELARTRGPLQQNASSGGGGTDYKKEKRGSKKESETARSVSLKLPPRGPLIDLYARGTVFAYIRKQYKRREKFNENLARRNRSTTNNPSGKSSARMTGFQSSRGGGESAEGSGGLEAPGTEVEEGTGALKRGVSGSKGSKRKLGSTNSERLVSLEFRMHRFMENCAAGSSTSKSGIRVQSLSKFTLDENKIPPKSGSVIVLRPVSRQIPIGESAESMNQIKEMFSDMKLPNVVT